MTCAQVRSHLLDWPVVSGLPAWSEVVRHTWECRACRAELVAVVVLAERVRMTVQSLPGPPETLRRAVLGGQDPALAAARPRLPARVRLAQARPYLPPLLRLAADPLALVTSWLPVASVPGVE